MAASDQTRRDAPGFYNFLALDRRPLDAPGLLGGLTGAIMSADPRTRSVTYVMDVPPGWSQQWDGKGASVEFFLLRGDMSLDGKGVASSGYIHLPQFGGGGELRSQGGALALVFWNPDQPCFPYPYTRNRAIKAWEEPWVNSMPGAHGVMHKSLRKPDPVPHPSDEGFDGGPGGYLRFQYIEPGMIAGAEHVHHECFEEIILLQGDVFLVNEGQMGIGSVVVHPQEWYHAPFASRSGAVILVHTDAPMGFPWPPRDYPEAQKLAGAYLDSAPWDVPTEHVAWADHPIAKMQEESAVYQAWRRKPCGCLWGDNDTGETVPYRPGGQGTASKFRASWARKEEDGQ
jgi:hypothetical protein